MICREVPAEEWVAVCTWLEPKDRLPGSLEGECGECGRKVVFLAANAPYRKICVQCLSDRAKGGQA